MAHLDLRQAARHRPPAYDADAAEERLACLLDAGFDEDAADKVFEAVDLPSPENIRGKIADLKALGFADPVKMITTLPAILGLAIENIRGKIADLKALGFADPVKMITSSPAILGYARERLLLAAGIVARLDDARPSMVGMLIKKRRAVIDAAAAAHCTTWAEVRAVMRGGIGIAMKEAA